LFFKKGKNRKAIEYLLKALEIRKATKDKLGEVYCFNGLSKVHLNISDSLKKQGSLEWNNHLDSALHYGGNAYQLSIEIGAVKRQRIN